jgi:hypothetical protein
MNVDEYSSVDLNRGLGIKEFYITLGGIRMSTKEPIQ